MKRDPIVLGKDYILPGDDIGISRPNANALIVGTTGCGKSTSVIMPTIARSKYSNPVISFAKESEGNKMAKYLSFKGYCVRVLNLIHPDNSTISYDNLRAVSSFEDISALTSAIVRPVIKKTNDDYWVMKSCSLLNALIAATLMESENKATIQDVLNMFDKTVPRESDFRDEFTTDLHPFFEKLQEKNTDCFACREFNSWASLPIRTAACIRDTLAGALSMVFPESIRTSLKKKPFFNLNRFINRKEAIIIISSGADKSQQYYANLFYRDLIRQLIERAHNIYNGELPREIRLFFDDFACTCPIEGFAADISLMRSIGLSAVMLLQSESQLESIYGSDAPIIRQNCAVYTYFPGGFDDRSCEIVSKRMGLPYEDIMYASLGKVFIMQSGRKPVYIPRYDTLASEEYREYKRITEASYQYSEIPF